MQCPDELELNRWEAGLLPANVARDVALHVQRCLRCQFVAGGATGEFTLDGDDAMSMRDVPPFEALRDRIRAAYQMTDTKTRTEDAEIDPCNAPPPYFTGVNPLDEPEPARLSADAGAIRYGPSQIPSFYAESGKLVVTFRVDPVTATVYGHFVAEDLAVVRCRPLLVGNRVFVATEEGSIVLRGITPDEALGLNIEVPDLVDEWTIYPTLPENSRSSETMSLLTPGAGDPRFPYASASCVLVHDDSVIPSLRGRYALRLDFAHPMNESRGVVVLPEKGAALVIGPGSTEPLSFDIGDALPKALRIRFYAVA